VRIPEDEMDFSKYNRAKLAHEIAHKLQQEFLGSLDQRAPSTDVFKAVRALVEGEATLVQGVYLSDRTPEDEAGVVMKQFGKLNQRAMDPATALLTSPYREGATFVARLFERGGWEEVSRVWRGNLPQSTEQVLHPEKYLAREPPEQIDLPKLEKLEAAGMKV